MKRMATWKNRERVVGIYRILCVPTGKSYIGASVDVHSRIKQHFYAMRTWPNEREMYRDANRFGLQNMEAEILVILNDPADLPAWEQYWIEQFDSVNNGYNHHNSGSNRHWNHG